MAVITVLSSVFIYYCSSINSLPSRCTRKIRIFPGRWPGGVGGSHHPCAARGLASRGVGCFAVSAHPNQSVILALTRHAMWVMRRMLLERTDPRISPAGCSCVGVQFPSHAAAGEEMAATHPRLPASWSQRLPAAWSQPDRVSWETKQNSSHRTRRLVVAGLHLRPPLLGQPRRRAAAHDQTSNLPCLTPINSIPIPFCVISG